MRLAATVVPGVAVLSVLTAASAAQAGAWVQPKGRGQVIVKYEDMRADDAFDADGNTVALSSSREDRALSVFSEYGLTDTLTVQLKGEWQSGQDALFDYDGRGPVEIGLTWQAWRNDHGAASLYAGYADSGDGRNAGYADPGVGGQDVEVRGALGWSFDDTPKKGRRGLLARLTPRRAFVDVQVAYRVREELADETRAEFTYGRYVGRNWMFLNQVYGGVAENNGSRWLNTETSIVRQFGAWRLQGGWRQSVAGRDTPDVSGPVIGVWRRF